MAGGRVVVEDGVSLLDGLDHGSSSSTHMG